MYANLCALAALVCLLLYALLGGADYGGGVWDLFARGPTAKAQRATIEHAIAPVWEANHVWLIVVVVILFTAFPAAFAALVTALHVPLTLMLVGVVLRGTAFTFRHYDSKRDDVQKRWGRVFAVASLFTPFLLGTMLGTIAMGGIRMVDDLPVGGFFAPWISPFPILVGLLTVVLFGFLAAVYLTNEPAEEAVTEAFRRRALASAGAMFVLGAVTLAVAKSLAPAMAEGLFRAPIVLVAGGLSLVGSVATVWKRRYGAARALAALSVTCVIGGWGIAQRPYLLPPDLTIANSAAPEVTLRLLVWALVIGSVTLVPSLYYLFRVFKGEDALSPLDRPDPGTTTEAPPAVKGSRTGSS
jgi:cytochrome bd ubiquinol oxidase subunit II